MGLLEGRVAIVTGGGRGLGRAHSIELAKQGATVIIVDPGVRLDGTAAGQEPAAEVVDSITSSGGNARWVNLSAHDFHVVGELIAGVVAEFGDLHIVVNNAGITRDRMITSMDERDWDDVIAVHLKGTFNFTKHAADFWRSRAKDDATVDGRIINTTSGAGMRGNIGQASYSAAKSAIANFTQVAAMELARYGVTVNAIAPVARTRMTDTATHLLASVADSPFDPFDPHNSSPIVAYLASSAAGWISGQIIRIDGNRLRFYRRPDLSDSSFIPGEERAFRADEVGTALRALYSTLPLGLGDKRLRRCM